MDDISFLASLKIAPLSEKYLEDKYFQTTHPKLEEFLYKYAPGHKKTKLAQTNLVLYKNKVVGYFSLLNDSLRLSKNRIRKHFKYPHPFYDCYPAIKIGRMATHKDFFKKGIGTLMVLHTISKAISINHHYGIGCRFITVDALKESTDFYKKQGFIITTNKDKDPDRNHPEDSIFMYIDINNTSTHPFALLKKLSSYFK